MDVVREEVVMVAAMWCQSEAKEGTFTKFDWDRITDCE